MFAVQSTTTTMQGYDDLTALLARNLTLNPIPAPAPVVQEQAPSSKITYSISQHYHHSAHMMHPSASEQQHQQHQQQEAEAAQPEQLAIEALLRQHGIDPEGLTPVQLALFRMSTPDRRDYLLQLWRICPQTSDAVDNEVMSLDGTAVSVAQQQQQQQQQQPQHQYHNFTTEQTADGHWQQSSASYMEPYMMSGYEELSRREYLASNPASDDSAVPRSVGVSLRTGAVDPVYNNRLDMAGRASWPPFQHLAAADMENQYGALMAMRDGAMEL